MRRSEARRTASLTSVKHWERFDDKLSGSASPPAGSSAMILTVPRLGTDPFLSLVL